MQSILAKRDQRYLQILEYLISHGTWTTIPLLADELDYPYQSLRSDIRTINDLIEPFKIETSQKYGIRLYIPEDYSLDFIYEQLLTNSLEFNFLELIFFNNNLTSEQLSEQLFVSFSTLTRMTNRLKKNIASYDLILKTAPFQINGDEKQIRHFFIHYFLERYPNKTVPFPDEQLVVIESLLNTFFDDLGVTLNYSQLHRLIIFSLVSLTRMQNNYHVTLPLIIRSDILLLVNNLKSDPHLILLLEESFNLTFNDVTLLEILFTFLNPDILLSVADLSHNLSTKKRTRLDYMEIFTEKLSQIFKSTPSSLNNLLFSLYNLDLLFIEHNYLLFNKKKHFVELVTKQYPGYAEELKQLLQKTSPYSSNPLSEEMQYEVFHLLVTHWPDLIDSFAKNMKKISIGIFGEFDYEHSTYLSDIVSHHFSKNVVTSVIRASTLNSAIEQSKAFDLVLTNYSNMKWLSKKSLVVNLVLSAEDLAHLQKIIYKLVSEKNLNN